MIYCLVFLVLLNKHIPTYLAEISCNLIFGPMKNQKES